MEVELFYLRWWRMGNTPYYISVEASPMEKKNSSVIEKKCLTVKWAVESLQYYLLGSPFILVMDHNTVKWLQTMKEDSCRLVCWYLALKPFSTVVCFPRSLGNMIICFSPLGRGECRFHSVEFMANTGFMAYYNNL